MEGPSRLHILWIVLLHRGGEIYTIHMYGLLCNGDKSAADEAPRQRDPLLRIQARL